MKRKSLVLAAAAALTLLLGGCDFFGFLFNGSDRILTLQVKATHANLPDGYQTDAILTQGDKEGKIFATLPAGANSSIQIEFTLDSGSLKVAGQTVTSPAAVDLSTVDKVYYVDPVGFEYPYVLDIAPTGLPTVFINTDSPILDRDTYINGTIAIVGGTTDYSIPMASAPITIKGRGNTTWTKGEEKRPYKMKFPSKTSVLGMPQAKNWVLLANFFDKTLIRNAVVMDTARELFPDTLGFIPRMKFIDLFLNNEYQGCYTLGDQVEIGSNRLNIGSFSGDDDTSYLLEVNKWIRDRDGGVEGINYFETAEAGYVVEFKEPEGSTEPDENEITATQKDWIKNRFTQIETKLINREDLTGYLDIDSFIDWAIIEEFFRNTDSGFISSVYLHKAPGGSLKIGPLWDFDLSGGNAEAASLREFEGLEALTTEWYDWLFYTTPSDPTTPRERFKARWEDVKSDLRTTTLTTIENHRILIARSAVWDAQRLPLTLDQWPQAFPTGLTRDAYTDLYKTWIEDRFDWLEVNIPGNNF